MRPLRRLADALRSPQRVLGLIVRVTQAARQGEIGPLLARIRPRSPSPSAYRAWASARERARPAEAGPPLRLLIALGADDDPEAARRFLDALGDPGGTPLLVRTGPGRWRGVRDGTERSLVAWTQMLEAECIAWVAAPLRLAQAMPARAAGAFRLAGARIVYADHDVAGPDGLPARAVFKPAWNRELALEQPYAGPLLLVHPALAADVDAAAPGTPGQWSLLLDAVSRLDPAAVVHDPQVLAHLPFGAQDNAVAARAAVADRVGAIADADPPPEASPARTPWLRHARPPGCRASIVVPTRDRAALLERCLRSVVAHGLRADDEIVVVDNGSTDPAVAALLDRLASTVALRVLREPAPFNFAQLCNAGVAQAQGRVAVLLNNDTEVVDDDWLDELVALAARPGTGAVGPLLLYPDGLVQSAGVVLGVNRSGTSAFAGYARDDPGVEAWCAARRRVSVVLGACMAVERAKYRQVGGMDERFAVSHNEIDLCLRLEAGGFANVFTPFARVVHQEGGTRGFEVTRAERARLAEEEAAFAARWPQVMRVIDPAHHPALARQGDPFALGPVKQPLAPRRGWRHAPLRLPADLGPAG